MVTLPPPQGRRAPYPDVLIYRVDAPLFFANAGWIRERVLALASQREPELRHLILDAEAVFYVDSTAAAALARLTVDLRARNCQLSIARARTSVLRTLHSNPYEEGVTQHLPTFSSVRAAFAATRRATP